MKQLTPQEKIELLEKAVKLIENKDVYFICPAVKMAFNKNISVFDYIPELLKHKPQTTFSEDIWWSAFGDTSHQNRINAIQQTINDIRKENGL